MRRIWDDFIPEEVKELYQRVGFGRRVGFGKWPVLLLVDMLYNSMGDNPEPVLESIKKYPFSCGESGWVAVAKTKKLLSLAREKQVPVIYTVQERELFDKGMWKLKMSPSMSASATVGQKGTQIVAELAPQANDIIVKKKNPSAFFGTSLLSYLNQLQVDTLIIAGGVTSSCVRATALDARQYNYYAILVEECVFDRHPFVHAVTLFEIDAKLADVVPLGVAKDYLKSLPAQEI